MKNGLLQRKIYQRLVDDPELSGLIGTDRIYDYVPKRRQFPFITLGEISSEDWSTDDETGRAATLTIRVWSTGRGRKEIYQISDQIIALLSQPLDQSADDDEHIVLARHLSSRFEQDVVMRAARATLRFRFLIEPKT